MSEFGLTDNVPWYALKNATFYQHSYGGLLALFLLMILSIVLFQLRW